MKVLFVYSTDTTPFPGVAAVSSSGIQFGISYLSSVLKQAGHECKLLLLVSSDLELSRRLMERSFAGFHPDVVAYTAVATQYAFIRGVAEEIRRKWRPAFQIVGGPHVSLNPEGVLGEIFDALCVGEGERPLLEVLDCLEHGRSLGAIQNIWSVGIGGETVRSATRSFLCNLDELPFPDRALWQPWTYQRANNTQAILLGRGCPYGCTYCSNHALRRLATGRYVRFRSPDNIIEEIRQVLERFPATPEIFFEVEAIALDKKWFMDFAAHLAAYNGEAGHEMRYSCNFRISAQSVREEVFEALRRANIRQLNIGLESGSERVRREVLKRDYTNEEFLEAVRLARKHGIEYNLFNMIGLPTETASEHMETVRLNRLANPRQSFTSIFYPYPGTELHDRCKEMGLLNQPLESSRERRRAAIDMPQFSRRQVQRAYTLFGFRIYKGNRSLLERLRMFFTDWTGHDTPGKLVYSWLRGLVKGARVLKWMRRK